jgi:hypothetical protein
MRTWLWDILNALPRNVLRERLTDEVERRMDLEALARTSEQERADKERLDELLGQQNTRTILQAAAKGLPR